MAEIFRQDWGDYADGAAMLAEWIEADPTGAGTWDLDATHVVGSSTAAHLNINGTVDAGQIYSITRTLGPSDLILPPGKRYTFNRQAYATAIIAGLPADQFNAIATTIIADNDGELELTLRVVITSGGTIDWDIWFDDVYLEETYSSWPRLIVPQRVSDFEVPGALMSTSETGRQQRRSTMQLGRRWSETYPPFKANEAAGRQFLATIRNHWRNGTAFDLEHYLHRTNLGGGSGSPLVAGASQTGFELDTDGWTGTDPVLKAGDLIQIAGIGHVLELAEDAPDLVSGATTLKLTTPFFSGGSPADNAAIQIDNVRLAAFIAQAPTLPDAGPDHYVGGLTLVFEEVVS